MSRYRRPQRSLWARSRNYRRLVWFAAFIAFLTYLAFNRPQQRQPPPFAVTAAPLAPPAAQSPPPQPAPRKPTLVIAKGNRLQDLPLAQNRWSEVLSARTPGKGFNAYYLDHGELERLHRAYHPYNYDKKDGSSVAWARVGEEKPSLARYADRWREAGRQIAEENSSSIRIHYNYNELKRIPAEDFAACWLGYIDIAQGGYYQFKPQGGGLARIILDRHLVSDGHAGQAPPQLWLEPGRYLLEVEYLNYRHTAEYALGLELASTRRTP